MRGIKEQEGEKEKIIYDDDNNNDDDDNDGDILLHLEIRALYVPNIELEWHVFHPVFRLKQQEQQQQQQQHQDQAVKTVMVRLKMLNHRKMELKHFSKYNLARNLQKNIKLRAIIS